jgi:hypothetical protein
MKSCIIVLVAVGMAAGISNSKTKLTVYGKSQSVHSFSNEKFIKVNISLHSTVTIISRTYDVGNMTFGLQVHMQRTKHMSRKHSRKS